MLAVTVLAADSAAAEPCVEGVEVSWVTSDGEQQKLLLEDAARVAFEHGLPARSYKARKGPVSYTHLTLPTNREV